MANQSRVAATLVGCVAVDTEGRRLGHVIGVIHRARGVDVLIEGRLWLRRRNYRFALEDVVQVDDGRLRVSVAHARGLPGVADEVGSHLATGADRR